jgi:peptide/nickel transport system substrate-binding protein
MMISMRPRYRTLSAAALCLLAMTGCVRDRPPAPDGVMVVSQEGGQTASWIRNFNPLTTATAARWPTLAGVYEPLAVYNSMQSKYVPWLAVSWEWRDQNRVLRITTREGVRWSDGASFTARDVAFTHNLLQKHPALDRFGIAGFVEAVRLVDDRTVDFVFQRVYIPGCDDILAQQIVPEHVWRNVDDPVAWPNETPVATGPFTEVNVFRNQVFELGRNPYYWQEGKPKVEALRFLAYPSNDRANLALVFDEVDWAGNFIPAIERVYVQRDPEHHRYWFPLTGSSVFLYANTGRAPFDDIRVRKALSMGIDRELLVRVAAHGYSRPADATGLSDAFTAWLSEDAVEAGDWVQYDPERAEALLEEAGHVMGPDGVRLRPDGQPWRYEIITVSGWSDWVRASQVIARGWRRLGLDVSVRTYDFGAWFQRVQRGEFNICIGWSFEGATPYLFYRWLMSSETIKPVGVDSRGNWHRFGSAAADRALRAFELAADPDEQRRLSDELQRIFVQEVPAIPLYPNPSWAEFNTRRFTGFPTPDNPYADPSPNKMDRGDCLLVLLNVEPREEDE